MKNSSNTFNGLTDYLQFLLNDGSFSTSEILFSDKLPTDSNKFQKSDIGISVSRYKAYVFALFKKIEVAELDSQEIGKKKYDCSNALKFA